MINKAAFIWLKKINKQNSNIVKHYNNKLNTPTCFSQEDFMFLKKVSSHQGCFYLIKNSNYIITKIAIFYFSIYIYIYIYVCVCVCVCVSVCKCVSVCVCVCVCVYIQQSAKHHISYIFIWPSNSSTLYSSSILKKLVPFRLARFIY